MFDKMTFTPQFVVNFSTAGKKAGSWLVCLRWGKLIDSSKFRRLLMAFIQALPNKVQMKNDPPTKKEKPADTSEEETVLADPISTDESQDQTNTQRTIPSD
jgi:hypothetical protein